MARATGDVRVFAGTAENLKAAAVRDGFETLHDLSTRPSRKCQDSAIARMDRQTLAGGEVVQHPVEHQLVFHVPP